MSILMHCLFLCTTSEVQSQWKSGHCFHNHSQIAISTSTLIYSRWSPKVLVWKPKLHSSLFCLRIDIMHPCLIIYCYGFHKLISFFLKPFMVWKTDLKMSVFIHFLWAWGSGKGCSWTVANASAVISDTTVFKFAPRCNKCISVLGDYVEK